MADDIFNISPEEEAATTALSISDFLAFTPEPTPEQIDALAESLSRFTKTVLDSENDRAFLETESQLFTDMLRAGWDPVPPIEVEDIAALQKRLRDLS